MKLSTSLALAIIAFSEVTPAIEAPLGNITCTPNPRCDEKRVTDGLNHILTVPEADGHFGIGVGLTRISCSYDTAIFVKNLHTVATRVPIKTLEKSAKEVKDYCMVGKNGGKGGTRDGKGHTEGFSVVRADEEAGYLDYVIEIRKDPC